MAHHGPLKALAPIEWDAIPQDSLAPFLTDILGHAQTVIDSIPLPAGLASTAKQLGSGGGGGRSRSHTDSAVPLGTVALNRALAGKSSPLALSSSSSRNPRREGAGAEEDDKGNDEEDARAVQALEQAQALQPEWKEVKLSARDNPLAVSVYKLSAKDGRGAWFARRSVHEGMGFDKWKAGLEREFLETLRVGSGQAGDGGDGKQQQQQPGSGNIRGIGAERRVESREVDGVGKVEVYQLSARFPGPSSPRDFVTFLLTSDCTPSSSSASRRSSSHRGRRPPRQFAIVSKPCVHPSCPQRQGFIRGQYESVEVIREVFLDRPLRKVRSSIDLSRDDGSEDGGGASSAAAAKEAILRSARRAAESDTERGGGGRTVSFAAARGARSDVGATASSDDGSRGGEDQDTAIEWLMVTRSDPGGSVPRFLVEKGTPGAIVSDAGKLLRWLEAKDMQALRQPEEKFLAAGGEEKGEGKGESSTDADNKLNGSTDRQPAQQARQDIPVDGLSRAKSAQAPPETTLPGPSGLYSMIAGALGAASSVVTTRLPMPFASSSARASSADSNSPTSDDGNDSDTSLHSYASAEEGPTPIAAPRDNTFDHLAVPPDKESSASILSEDSTAAASTNTTTTTGTSSGGTMKQHEKELRKLQDRHRKIQEKIERAHERWKAKNGGGDSTTTDTKNSNNQAKNDDEAAAKERAKLREKHEREQRRQEDKYQKELARLAQRRAAEERKAGERARKARDKEERENAQLALERARAERDLARKEVEVLTDTVGELQAQNTMLVARLGRLGLLGAGAGGASGGGGATGKEQKGEK